MTAVPEELVRAASANVTRDTMVRTAPGASLAPLAPMDSFAAVMEPATMASAIVTRAVLDSPALCKWIAPRIAAAVESAFEEAAIAMLEPPAMLVTRTHPARTAARVVESVTMALASAWLAIGDSIALKDLALRRWRTSV